MKKNKYLVLLVLIVLTSCRRNVNEDSIAMNHSTVDIGLIRNKLFSGDKEAYFELRSIYLDQYPGDFLYYAMFMANKYDSDIAYLDVYDCFNDSNIDLEFNKRDIRTQKIMLEYLNEAIKRNVDGAKDRFAEIKKNSQKE